jgi:hypothetical protein
VDLAGLLDGYSYIHRSIVAAPDGRLYVGATWVCGAGAPVEVSGPLPAGNFVGALALLRWFGRFVTSCRIIVREPDGLWRLLADHPYISVDLAWDTARGRLLRVSQGGITCPAASCEARLVPPFAGFVHALAVGPGGELLSSDGDGGLLLLDSKGDRIRLGSLEDDTGKIRAAPGIDGLVAAGPHHLVGGTRNLARPFVVDLRGPSLRVLPPSAAAPRASAFCRLPDGKVLFATGVGHVELFRLDPEESAPEPLGVLAAEGIGCHHVHDLAVTADGRILAGEFFPLDVRDPPWPKRECYLWEIDLTGA